MKKILLVLLFISVSFNCFSQTPGISYQAVILSPNAKELPGASAQTSILANSEIAIQFTIIDAFGNREYQEYQQTTTDAYGMINLLIGDGTVTSSNNFDDIEWNGSSKKLQVDIDFSGSGNNFTFLNEQELTFMPQPVTGAFAESILNNTQDIQDEVTRAQTAESANAMAISDETTRATAAEATLTTDLATEVTNRTNADVLKEDKANKSIDVAADGASDIKYPSVKSVKTYVDASATAASAALATEVTRAQTAESANAMAISDETIRATAAEATLTTDLATEVTNRTNADVLKEDKANKSIDVAADGASDIKYPSVKSVKTYVDASATAASAALATEVTRAQTAESTNATAISDETTRATGAEATLTTDLATEVTNRTNADVLKEDKANKSIDVAADGASDIKYPSVKSVKTYVDASATAASTALAAEVTRATGAETVLTNNLATEVTRAQTAESTNATAISDETTRAEGIETNIQNELDATQTGAGLGTDGSYTANGSSNYIKSSTSIVGATEDLDAQVKTNADAILNNNTNLQNELDATQTGAGLGTDGSYTANGSSNYIKSSTSIVGATEDLDAQVKTNADAILNNNTNLQDELDATQTGSGLGTDGSYTANGSANYIKASTSIVGATEDLDAQVKTNADAIGSINTLADGKVYLGNASNQATEVTLSGDVTIDNTGVSAIGTSKVLTGMIADANITTSKIADANITNAKLDKANIPLSGFGAAAADVALGANKLTGVKDPTLAQDAATKNYVDNATSAINTLADGKVYLGNASNQATEVTLSGDVTINNTGVSTIGTSKVLTGMIADANVTTSKIADANVTDAKLDKANISLSGFASTTSAQLAAVISDESGTGNVVLAVSPTFTGLPLAPTAAAGTNTTQIATTAFVMAAASSSKFVDLTTNQTIAGVKTFSNDVIVNGVKIGRGTGNNSENTAIGNAALGTGTGSRNSAFGNGALRNYAGTGFDNNTSVGFNNLQGLTTGSGNTSVGAESMMGLSTGTSNTSIGNQSLINTTGNNNVGIGKSSGSTLTSGSNNTIIGTVANVATNNQTNSTAIGYGAIVSASNTIQLGNTSITDVKTSGAITATGYKTPTGTSIEYLMADGSVSTGTAPVREVADEFSATASQTSFTLSQTPSVNSKVKMYINGIRISNAAYSTSGTTLTYVPANNGGYALAVNDRIQMDYYY